MGPLLLRPPSSGRCVFAQVEASLGRVHLTLQVSTWLDQVMTRGTVRAITCIPRRSPAPLPAAACDS